MIEKVAAFIIRAGSSGPELLVFRQPGGGLQLPGGSIEMGETVVAAAVRETAEETGLTGLRVERIIGSPVGPPPENLYALLEPVAMQISGSEDQFVAGRGWLVSIESEEGENVRVVYRERDWDASPVKTIWQAVGVARRTALTDRVVRHLVLLRCDQPQPDEWDWQSIGDAGGVYRCLWLPLVASETGEGLDWRLPEGAHLLGEQDAWLAYMRGAAL